MKIDPGLYVGIPMATYQMWEARNFSTLKLVEPTLAHARYYMRHPKESPALNFGAAYHCAVLEPKRFEEEWRCTPDVNLNSTKGKAEMAAFQAAHLGKKFLRPREWQQVTEMQDAALSKMSIAAHLAPDGFHECCVVAELDGVLCKARYDRVHPDGDVTIVTELKTAKDAQPWAFSKAIDDFDYAAQAAFQMDLANAVAYRRRAHVFIAQEKTPPYEAALYRLKDSAVAYGRRCYQRWLDTLEHAIKHDEWPGYPDQVQSIDLPDYAYRREDMDGTWIGRK